MNKLILGLILSTSFSVSAHHSITENEKDCQVLNVYHEARSESEKGQYLVLDVVKNRSESTKWPHNLCDVIYQKSQFSWAINGWKKAADKKALKKLRLIVERYYNGLNVGISKGSTHYHADYVRPKWSRVLKRVSRVGTHIFYKIK